MKLLKLLALWLPFGAGEDESPDPSHFHVLVGAQTKFHELEGSP